MSWYTYLYPDWDYNSYKTIDELQEHIDKQQTIINDCWYKLSCVVASTPHILFPNEDAPLELTINLFNNCWDNFIKNSITFWNLSYLHQFWQNQIDHDNYIKDYPNGNGYKYSEELGREMTDDEYKAHIEKERADWKSYVYYNHFEYSDRPYDGVEETEKFLNKAKSELLMLCTCDKSLCTCEEYDNPFDAVVYKVDNMREWLNELTQDRYFSQLCVKYWNTREVG